MARGLTTTPDRRNATRVVSAHTSWSRAGLLRPGQEVDIINLSASGALVESPGRLKPGARTELQMRGVSRCTVRGRVARCRVIGLDPMRYEGAIAFDDPIDQNTLGSE